MKTRFRKVPKASKSSGITGFWDLANGSSVQFGLQQLKKPKKSK